MSITLTSLTLFPVKSCAPLAVSRFRCGTAGPEWDREWMIVGGDGKFVTQRELPKLALVRPHLDIAGGVLRLSAETIRGGVEIPLSPQGNQIETEIWETPVPAFDEGIEASRWLSDFLGVPLRLARITNANRRREGEDPRTVRFVDSYPLHLASLTSLSDLNKRLPAPIEILRFRANFVIDGAPPWAEDNWTGVRIGGNHFRIGKRCERCTITTVDPASGTRGAEPLKTLATFRRNERNKIEFGQYLHSSPGAEISVGMKVEAE